jgi:hypothetical protein
MSFIALSLGLDGHFFDDKLSNPLSTLRLLHYWPLVRPPDLRAPADVGMHTCALILCTPARTRNTRSRLRTRRAFAHATRALYAPPTRAIACTRHNGGTAMARRYFLAATAQHTFRLRGLSALWLTADAAQTDFKAYISAGAHTDYGCCTILLQARRDAAPCSCCTTLDGEHAAQRVICEMGAPPLYGHAPFPLSLRKPALALAVP